MAGKTDFILTKIQNCQKIRE